ncbi:MAG: NADH dehydrogenase FAD-containing subunit [Elusimicrobia bacterium]|nr:NADH dehydrogenase FAD-containing subunit [Elusimicrobiota bacterium]
MIWTLLGVPLASAAAAFAIRADGPRRGLLLAAALTHAALTAACWTIQPAPVFGGYLALDAAGRLFLSLLSALFLAASFYGAGYLRAAGRTKEEEDAAGFLFANAPEAVFTGCLLCFLGTMSLAVLSQHFGLLWVGIEATTLCSAPLIHFHRQRRSLEATWKYLLVCSVGIALALLGNFFLAVAARQHHDLLMTVPELVAQAGRLDKQWLKAAFLLFLVGYGTKMGLAPMHTWLPDAHSEAPSVVSALLSGALLNCAFLALLRVNAVLAAAGLADFSGELLVGFGLLSMAVAAAFIIGQGDFKRLLAYSSVEHMGILAFGAGLGAAAPAALLHAVNHSLTKGFLFLTAGNLLAASRTKSVGEIRGLLRALPRSGALWLVGFLAITGSPPFGTFVSELWILQGALARHRGVLAALYLAFLAAVFAAMASVVLKMSQGEPSDRLKEVPGDDADPWRFWPPALLAAAVLVLGLWVPPPLLDAVREAAAVLGMR